MALTKTQEEVKKELESKYPLYEYVGGYVNGEGFITVRCKECGLVFSCTAQVVRPSSKKNIVCDGCMKKDNEIRKLKKINDSNLLREINKQRTLKKQERKLIRIKAIQLHLLAHIKIIKRMCLECDTSFTATNKRRIYCSEECGKKYNDRRKSLIKRSKTITNGAVEWGINIKRIIKRDSGICHICGEECDSNDYVVNTNGVFIAGRRYPSVDHIVPIAKGGTHTWNNVKLAHCQCNSIKGANIIYNTSSGQVQMAL